MDRFTVTLQNQPKKYYKKCDGNTAINLEECFIRLEENPFFYPGKIKRLKGKELIFRYATDGLRVVYEINMTKREVGVLAILPRGDVYKRL